MSSTELYTSLGSGQLHTGARLLKPIMQASLPQERDTLLYNLAKTDTEDMSNNLLGSLGNNFATVFTHGLRKGC